MASVFLASSPLLPADSPYGFPHIVDITDNKLQDAIDDQRKLRLHVADGVATVLFDYDPQALTDFLDLRCPSFSFHRSEPSRTFDDLYIERENDIVLCGFYIAQGEWDYQYVYRISASGQWIPISGLGRKGMSLTATDDEETAIGDDFTVGGCGKSFAATVIQWGKWKEAPGVKISASSGRGTVFGERRYA